MVVAENGLIIREPDRNNLTCNVCGGELTFGEGEYGLYRVLCCNRSYVILPETYKVLALALNEFNIDQEIKANTLEVIEETDDEETEDENDTKLENEQIEEDEQMEQSQEQKEQVDDDDGAAVV